MKLIKLLAFFSEGRSLVNLLTHISQVLLLQNDFKIIISRGGAVRWAEQGLSSVEQGKAGCIIFLTNEEIGALRCVQGHKGSK